MKRNLVPERIVNKNGVHTTVYRKPDKGNAGKAEAIPAVSLATRVDLSRYEALDFLSMKIRQACRGQYSSVNDVDQPTIVRSLDSYSTLTLQRLYAFLDTPELSRTGSKESVVAHAVANGDSEEFISDFINFGPTVRSASAIRSMRYYPQIRERLPLDSIDPDGPLSVAVSALTDLVSHVARTYETYYDKNQGEPPYDKIKIPGTPSMTVLKDERLVDLIIDRPQDLERIKGIIDDRHGTDYEVIADALSNGSALGNGTL